ncbi:hypothetical protein KAI32_02740 [Candidatus Pacearchaeota archaeon]|nr:hypothetical protein [Candidatus Pacearchaeota archaeon]
MRRIKFEKGEQRKFLDLIIEKLNAPSLRGLLQFGFDVPYSTLKNYYNESRSLPEDFFKDLCDVAKVDKGDLRFEFVESNLGQVRGGQIGKRRKV